MFSLLILRRFRGTSINHNWNVGVCQDAHLSFTFKRVGKAYEAQVPLKRSHSSSVPACSSHQLEEDVFVPSVQTRFVSHPRLICTTTERWNIMLGEVENIPITVGSIKSFCFNGWSLCLALKEQLGESAKKLQLWQDLVSHYAWPVDGHGGARSGSVECCAE